MQVPLGTVYSRCIFLPFIVLDRLLVAGLHGLWSPKNRIWHWRANLPICIRMFLYCRRKLEHLNLTPCRYHVWCEFLSSKQQTLVFIRLILLNCICEKIENQRLNHLIFFSSVFRLLSAHFSKNLISPVLNIIHTWWVCLFIYCIIYLTCHHY